MGDGLSGGLVCPVDNIQLWGSGGKGGRGQGSGVRDQGLRVKSWWLVVGG